jgi:hypothetical protein
MNVKRKILFMYLGIGCYAVYGFVIFGFIATKSSMALTIWEVYTIISAVLILLLLLTILTEVKSDKTIWKSAAIVSMSCTTILTTVIHFVMLTVTRPIADSGIAVPDYFLIGKWPSVHMAIEYLAWGFFMGLAFVFTALALNREELRIEKITIMICGLLCIAGLTGPILSIESLWFISVAGYAIGTPVICIQMIHYYKKHY